MSHRRQPNGTSFRLFSSPSLRRFGQNLQNQQNSGADKIRVGILSILLILSYLSHLMKVLSNKNKSERPTLAFNFRQLHQGIHEDGNSCFMLCRLQVLFSVPKYVPFGASFGRSQPKAYSVIGSGPSQAPTAHFINRFLLLLRRNFTIGN